MIETSEWRWFGNAGHFICSQWCQFHLCTEVGEVLVSTVGQYFPDEGVREILAKSRGVTLEGMGDDRTADYMEKLGFEDIGYKRKFETMVFRITGPRCELPDCDCGMPKVSWSELDTEGYNRAGDAARGHMAICERWAVKQ